MAPGCSAEFGVAVWQLQIAYAAAVYAQRDVTLELRGKDTNPGIGACLILSSKRNFARLLDLQSDENQRQDNRKYSNDFGAIFPIRTIQ